MKQVETHRQFRRLRITGQDSLENLPMLPDNALDTRLGPFTGHLLRDLDDTLYIFPRSIDHGHENLIAASLGDGKMKSVIRIQRGHPRPHGQIEIVQRLLNGSKMPGLRPLRREARGSFLHDHSGLDRAHQCRQTVHTCEVYETLRRSLADEGANTIVAVVVTMTLSCLPVFWTGRRLAATWIIGFLTYFVLMKGGIFGLPLVREEQWGGLSLTLFIFIATSLIGMPLAIVLALLRNSEMPWIAKTTGALIDSIRSLPLISILFTFAIVLPFMLPGFLIGEKLYRVVIGAALFFAAYQAEIIRGGMQGVAKGQDEAAKALGISYWHRISRITLPQAFRNALPATINQFVITFMETSLVVIVGFFELLASANAAYGTGDWTFAFVEVYVFVAAIYFVFVFGLSRYGAYLERRMSVGQR